MDKNEVLLTVLVTTYNRKPCIEKITSLFTGYIDRGLKFKLLISDDCSSDGTKELCEKLAKENTWLDYYQLDKNSGMDANFRNAYIHCTTKYCWLLGDHRYIEYEELKDILDTLSGGKYDALILKCREEAPKEDIIYTDVNKLFKEIGFNITNNASCVIPTSFYNDFLYRRYKGTTFLHMGIFLENIATMDNVHVKYLSNVLIKNLIIKGFHDVGWTSHPFLNFGKYWVNFVCSLPPCITAINKNFVLKQHNKITKLFSLHNIAKNMAEHPDVYVKSYKESKMYMKYASNVNPVKYEILISFIPSKIYKLIASVYRNIHHK